MRTSAEQKRVVVITGASHGIGAACADAFLQNGDTVYGLCRTAPQNPAVLHIPTDLTSDEACAAAVARIVSEAGRIDVLLLNAGIGVSGAVEFTALSEAQRQFDVCYFGALRVLTPALCALRQSKGVVLFTSSVAAVTPIPFQAHYSACKAAISALAMALKNELRHTGVRVAAVLPGDVKTDFTAARRKDTRGQDVYPALVRSVAKMEHDEQHGMAPARIARRMLALSLRRNPKPFCSVGLSYRAVCTLVKLLPARFVAWVLGKMYG